MCVLNDIDRERHELAPSWIVVRVIMYEGMYAGTERVIAPQTGCFVAICAEALFS